MELAKPFAMSLPAVSKHLKVLERAGLISRSPRSAMAAVPHRAARAQGGRRLARTLSPLLDESFDRLDGYLKTLQAKDPPKEPRAGSKSQERQTWPQKVASTSRAIRARSSACANSMRRAIWSLRRGPIPSIWRNGGGRTASPPRPSSFDLRPGGVWRFVMHGPDGRDYQNRITFDEVVPPERIVYRHGGGEDVEPVQFRQTVIFEDLGGTTRITWRGDFPSAAERDRVIREYGADAGLVQTMERLADYVAAQSA